MLQFFQKLREREKSNYGNNNADRLLIFDYFRAISCLLIYCLHLITFNYKGKVFPYYHLIFNILPMTVFFFTTGYLISMSLEKETNWKSFAIKRFFRLVPVLLVAHVIALFTIRSHISIKDFFLNVFMLTDVFYLKQNAWNHALIFTTWSLWVEMKFYIIACFCFAIFKNRNNKRAICYMQITIATIISLLLVLFKVPWFQNGSFNCTLCVFVVFSGMLMYFYRKRYIKLVEYLILSIICIAVPIFIFRTYVGTDYTWLEAYGKGAVITTIIFLLFSKRVKENRFIKTFADLSYSFYLLHPVALFMATKFWSFQKNDSLTLLFKAIGHRTFFAILILCVCYVIYHKIEKPAYEFGRKIAKRIMKSQP